MNTALDIRPVDRLASRLGDWFDFPELFGRIERGFTNPLRVEEERTDDALIIRAEMPGCDPERDVDIEVVDDMLRVRAERREEERSEKNGAITSEFRYGTYSRSLPVPRGTTADAIKASYKDGILEIVVPRAEPVAPAAAKVAITRS
jgi:HSP20 family protein